MRQSQSVSVRLVHVVGARPNFMKAAPVMQALAARPGCCQALVHTGQHYDSAMSDIFFQQLGLPQPDANLEVGSGSHAVQTAQIMMRFEEYTLAERPDWVLVYGDVNSTVAAALVCAKLQIPVAHVEAGLRSFDRTMPEEINRVLTDQIAELLFTPSEDGDRNLLREGVAPEKILLVGNVMIDTLVRLLPQAEARWPQVLSTLIPGAEARKKVERDSYALVTLHRPSNVDDPQELHRIMRTLRELSGQLPVIFPVHPRTRQHLADWGLDNSSAEADAAFHLAEPVGYLDFLALQRHARIVITDSGGIQEETTFLGVPCLTVRENTERPVTVERGTNILVGRDMERLLAEALRVLAQQDPGDQQRSAKVPPLWDGKAGERIADALLRIHA